GWQARRRSQEKPLASGCQRRSRAALEEERMTRADGSVLPARAGSVAAKVRPIIAAEAAECGLASLAMVASAHGLHLGLGELRRRFPMSLKGARLGQLIQIAQRLGLAARPLRLALEELGQLRLPCILHWDLNHFVVLARV